MAGSLEDEEEEEPIHPQAPPHSNTCRRAIGPQMSDTVGFWQEVFSAIDEEEAEVRLPTLTATGI